MLAMHWAILTVRRYPSWATDWSWFTTCCGSATLMFMSSCEKYRTAETTTAVIITSFMTSPMTDSIGSCLVKILKIW